MAKPASTVPGNVRLHCDDIVHRLLAYVVDVSLQQGRLDAPAKNKIHRGI
jgi:hypothetical protein